MTEDNMYLQSKTIDLTIDGLYAWAVYGALCLGLRHPAFTGPSRELVLHFINELEKAMKAKNILNDREIWMFHILCKKNMNIGLNGIREGP